MQVVNEGDEFANPVFHGRTREQDGVVGSSYEVGNFLGALGALVFDEVGFVGDDGVGAPGAVGVEAGSVVGGNQQAAGCFPGAEGGFAGVPVG